MSLDSGLQSLVVRIATELKSIRTGIAGNSAGSLAALTTTDKSSLLAAINEVMAALSALSTTVTSSTYTNTMADARVQAAKGNTGTPGSPGSPSTSQWTSTQDTVDYVSGRISALVGGAGTTLDTLAEIAAALGNDPDLAATLSGQIANKVGFVAQTLTAPQQAQARTNIGAVSTDDIGATNTNYVSVFEAALV